MVFAMIRKHVFHKRKNVTHVAQDSDTEYTAILLSKVLVTYNLIFVDRGRLSLHKLTLWCYL